MVKSHKIYYQFWWSSNHPIIVYGFLDKIFPDSIPPAEGQCCFAAGYASPTWLTDLETLCEEIHIDLYLQTFPFLKEELRVNNFEPYKARVDAVITDLCYSLMSFRSEKYRLKLKKLLR